MTERGRPKRYLTLTEYAHYKDVSPALVTQAVQTGRIKKISSGNHKGKIDTQVANEMWDANRLTESLPKDSDDEPVHKERAILVNAKAKMAAITAERELIKLKREKGEIVDRKEALRTLETLSRQNRDMWLNLSKRVSHEAAEELGVETSLFYDVLHKIIRDHLESIATMDLTKVVDVN